MEAKPRELLNYATADFDEPFQIWIKGLKDAQGRAKIRARLNRVRLGNLGNCKPVGEGVCELKIDFGPGYRVYFGQEEEKVILLTGGDKSTQSADVQRAKEYWRDYNAQKDD